MTGSLPQMIDRSDTLQHPNATRVRARMNERAINMSGRGEACAVQHVMSYRTMCYDYTTR